MATNKDNCGITSILPTSCRGRAEDFARRLHARLRSLGSQDDTSPTNETTWLSNNDIKPLTISQPKYTENEAYYLPKPRQEILLSERLRSNENESLNTIDNKNDFKVAPIKVAPIIGNTEVLPKSEDEEILRENFDTEINIYGDLLNNSRQAIEESSQEDNVDILSSQNCANELDHIDNLEIPDNNILENSCFSCNEDELLTCQSCCEVNDLPLDSGQILNLNTPDLEIGDLNLKFLNRIVNDSDLNKINTKPENIARKNQNDIVTNNIENYLSQNNDKTSFSENRINATSELIENFNDVTSNQNDITDDTNNITFTLHLKSHITHDKSDSTNHTQDFVDNIKSFTHQIDDLTDNILNINQPVSVAKETTIIEDLDVLENKLNVSIEAPVFAKSTINHCLDEAETVFILNGDNRLFAKQLTEEIVSNALNAVNINSYKISYSDDFRIDSNIKEVSECELGLNNNRFLSVEDIFAEDEDRIPRVRRCSSLKTGKTPPGTPSRKKIVRFADVLGLDLADVRTYLDEIPKVPNSAYSDLPNANFDEQNSIMSHINKNQRTLLGLFQQPGALANFVYKVKINQVMLENAIFDDPIAFSIKGIVRVRNLDFNKSVHVRYSWDSWQTFSDLQAVYVENSCDGFSDKFSFVLYAHQLTIGQRIEFAVRFQCKGTQYWDNNGGANYCFQCLPISNPTPYAPLIGMDEQMASFYYLDDNADEQPNADVELTHKAVQDYIMHSLEKNDKHQMRAATSKPDFLTIFIILFISVVFFYVKKATFLF